jgi:hypothetical protein
MFESRPDPMADLCAYLRAADFPGKFSAERDPILDSLVVRFEVLGRPEVLRFSSLTSAHDIAHAVWLLRDTRFRAVGPEFHMASQLAARNFAQVDPYGRPA